MYSTYNEGKTVIVERFIRTLKYKIYKKETANESKSYLSYLNTLLHNTIVIVIALLVRNQLMLIILLWLKKLS